MRSSPFPFDNDSENNATTTQPNHEASDDIPPPAYAPHAPPGGGVQDAAPEAVLEARWRSSLPASYEPPITIPGASEFSSRAALLTSTRQSQQSAFRGTSSSILAERPSRSLVQSTSERAGKRAWRGTMAAPNVPQGESDALSSLTVASAIGLGSEPLSGGRAYEDLPTMEMVRILNVRLQPSNETSTAGGPPVYEEIGR